MPDTTLSDLVDAVAADIAENVTLPAHSVWLYVDPPMLRPDLGTLLAIFPKQASYTVLATNDSYQDENELVIAWYVPMLEGVETGGIGNPAVAESALGDAEAIIAQLRSYATAVPGLGVQSEGTLESSEFGTLAGAPVWAARITLKVAWWPNTPSDNPAWVSAFEAAMAAWGVTIDDIISEFS